MGIYEGALAGSIVLAVGVVVAVVLSRRRAAVAQAQRERQVAPPSAPRTTNPIQATIKASGPLLQFDKEGKVIPPERSTR